MGLVAEVGIMNCFFSVGSLFLILIPTLSCMSSSAPHLRM